MLQINKVALDNIRASQITGESVADTFIQMAERIEQEGDLGGMLILNYLDQEEPKEGELVPSITLTLKPFSKSIVEVFP